MKLALKKRLEWLIASTETAEPMFSQAQNFAEAYIHSCRVDDGGYFFARIPPGSLLDTWYAVETLTSLGTTPRHPEALEDFIRLRLENARPGDIHIGYLISGIVERLFPATDLRQKATELWADVGKGTPVSPPDDLYIEVTSELRRDFEYVSLLRRLGLPLSRNGLVGRVHSFRNEDGGYGSGHSTLPATADALETLRRLGETPPDPQRTISFLDSREAGVYYLEDLFHLVRARDSLGQAPREPEDRLSFVLACQRQGGGFSRAAAIGIPTLEHTYQAVSVLSHLSFLDKAGTGEQNGTAGQ